MFETDEKKEIACVTCPMIDRTGDTETSQDRFGSREESKRACYPEMKKRVERKFKKVKTSNSYNEEFDPGSG